VSFSRFSSRRWRLAMLGLFAVAFTGCTVRYRHEVEKPGTKARYQYAAGGFIRYDGYDDVAGDLEVASIDFKKPGSEITIRLTGAIHIGDLEYYRTLQRECLDTADVVLFEGVKFKGEPDEAKKKQGEELGNLYSQMGKLLGIGFQKDGIDYKRANFVHCDITVGKDDPLNKQVDMSQMAQATQMLGPLVSFKQLMASGPDGKRMEDALKHQMVAVMTAQMGGIDDEELLKKIRSQSRKDNLPPGLERRAEKAAEALRGLPILPEMGMSKEMKEQVLDRRNDYVIEQLKKRLDGEDQTKKQTIAIFYGAAHGPGIAKGMKAWGYEPVATTWLRAWTMDSRGLGVVSERYDGKTGPGPSKIQPRRHHPKRKRKGEPVLF